MSQAKLARLSGVAQSWISRLEKRDADSANLRTVRSLERGLGMPAGGLDAPHRDEHPSLAAFLRSQLAEDLDVTAEEAQWLRERVWYTEDEEPTALAWSRLLEARRALKRRGG